MSPPSSSTRPQRTEHIYVLYGSQTGNSEQAAQELCAQVPTKLSSRAISKLAGVPEADLNHLQVTASHMQLDDFLEIRQCEWTKLIVIITSSYGVGQAPLGCYRFRDLCDAWLDLSKKQQQQQQANDPLSSPPPPVLQGLTYAMCGLGDSKYTTYFRNPTVIDAGLQAVGATRVGDLGKANASGVGDQMQSKVIERWMNGIWKHLALALVQHENDPTLLSPERLRQMQQETIKLCCQINPEFPRPDKSSLVLLPPLNQILASLLVALIASMVGYYYFFTAN